MNDRIRVLLLIKGLGVGGAERLLERAVPYFDRDRYDYRVAYFLPWKDALVPAFKDGGIPVTAWTTASPPTSVSSAG
jgi:hypothetical protein